MRWFSGYPCGILSLVVLVLSMEAQTTLGTILGTVRDTSGSVVAGAKVTVVNVGTNVRETAFTNDNGYYEVPRLIAGVFQVSVEAPGFRTFEQTGVPLTAGGSVRVDVALELGVVTEKITVTAEVGVIETEKATIVAQRSYEQFRAAPYNYVGDVGNAFYQFATLPNSMPIRSGGTFFVAGVRSNANQFQGDGLTSVKRSGMSTYNEFNVEGQDEVRLISVNATAEFASPATYQQTSRSGTNTFHGSLDFRHTNPALTAREWYQSRKAPRHRNLFGGWLGGPVVLPGMYDGHDRTFFGLSYRGSYSPIGNFRTAQVPTAQFRSGDFSQLVDPAFMASAGLAQPIFITDPTNSQRFPNNVIPASRINPVSRRIQDRYYPSPNKDGVLFANYEFFNKSIGPGNMYGLRTDHRFSDRDLLAVTVALAQSGSGRLNLAGELLSNGFFTTVTDTRSTVVAWNHSFGPSMFNEVRTGFNRIHNIQYGPALGLNVLESLGITGTVYRNPNALGHPVISVTGFATLSQTNFSNSATQGYQFIDGFTMIRGAHTIKAGFDYRRARGADKALDSAAFGNFSFTNAFTGYSYSDFLLGTPTTTARSSPRDSRYQRYSYVAGYIQDDFKLHPDLTINVGLRYEYQTPVTDGSDILFNFDRQTGNLVLSSPEARQFVNPLLPSSIQFTTPEAAGMPANGFRYTDKNNFSPRVGFAYRFAKNTVLRAGYGLFYDILGLNFISDQQAGGIFNFSESFSNLSGVRGRLSFPNPFDPVGSIGATSVAGFVPNLPLQNTQQWNLTLERSLGDISLRVTYLGAKNTQLAYRQPINKPLPSTTPFSNDRRPWPQFRDVTLVDVGANSTYHALQIGTTRRKNGLTFDAHYTWAHGMDDAEESGDVGALIENPFSRSVQRARVSYIPNQRMVVNLMYSLPVGRNRKFVGQMPRWMDAIVGGWDVTWLSYFQTGDFATPVFSGRDPSNTDTLGGRPDRVGNGNFPVSQRDPNRWFDAAAFEIPPVNAGRFGNSGRNLIEGPGLRLFHFAVLKSFNITEKVKFQFMMPFQNAFNHPTYLLPNMNISAPGSVGRVPQTVRGATEGTRAREIGLNAYLIF
jgi:hypothetical protein